MAAETVATERSRTSAEAAPAVSAQPANSYVYWAVAFLTTLECVGWPPTATSVVSTKVEPSSMYQETTTAGGSDSPVISAMEPLPEKETEVTWSTCVESGMAETPEAFSSVCSPAVKVTVGVAPV